jgi:hypothetical protein
LPVFRSESHNATSTIPIVSTAADLSCHHLETWIPRGSWALAVSERVDLRSALASAIAAGQRTYGGRRPRRERGRWVVSIGIAAWARTQMQVSLPESRAPLSCATTQIQAVPVLVFVACVDGQVGHWSKTQRKVFLSGVVDLPLPRDIA